MHGFLDSHSSAVSNQVLFGLLDSTSVALDKVEISTGKSGSGSLNNSPAILMLLGGSCVRTTVFAKEFCCVPSFILLLICLLTPCP